MEFQSALALCALAVATAALLFRRRRHSPSRPPLPPGPPPLPLIGNALDMPTKDLPATFRKMCAQYGDVMHLDLLGQPLIVLGSHEAAIDLLEKRSTNYSDRPPSVIAKVSTAEIAFVLQRYGPWWRAHRKTFHRYFSPSAVHGYASIQRLEAHRLVLRLIDEPRDFLRHIRRLFGSSIMRIGYGIDVDEEPFDFLGFAEETLTVFSAELELGKHLVETFPILRFLPSWMPGAKFKRDSVGWRKLVDTFVNAPWERTRAAMKAGVPRSSMAADLIEQLAQSDKEDGQDIVEETIAKNAVAAAYAGGADTTVSTVQSFFLAMASYPKVQKRAQEELEAVVGPHRLPEFDDMESLPYIRALIKECLRWRSVVPLAVPHRTMEDDEYRGYLIPKGSIVIPNIWAFSRDPEVYSDPEVFTPERFMKDGHLDPNVCDPATIAFGYGRRICPGRHYAESALFIIAASILHTLSITAPLDDQGKPVPLEGKMTHGMLSYPEPFECIITPRSPTAEALIRASCADRDSLRR